VTRSKKKKKGPESASAREAADNSRRETVGFRRRRERRERAAAFLDGAPLIVGLDLAKDRHAVWFSRKDHTSIRRFMIANSPEGLGKLVEDAKADCEEHELDRVLVFMEATSYFWQNVANWLEAAGVAYRTVSSLAVDRQREIEHQTYAKGDYRDAELIAKLGADGNWLHRVLDTDPVWIELRALALEHEAILEQEVSEQLRVRSFLGLALPEFTQYFADPMGDTARSVLRTLGRPLAETPRTFAALKTRAADVRGHRLHLGKLRALLAGLDAAPSYGVERALGSALVRIGMAVERFDLLAEQRRQIRDRLVMLYEALPYQRFLVTIPGVVAANHALVLGLVGDPKRYDRASCLVKLAGTEPRENHSGLAEGSHSISRRGQSPLRCIVYRIVMGFARGNPHFYEYARRLQSRDDNALKWRQAAVAAGNKYLRLVHRLCVSGEVYNPDRLVTR
jgi:transposase